jgi:hypothetical protein
MQSMARFIKQEGSNEYMGIFFMMTAEKLELPEHMHRWQQLALAE